MYVTVSTEVDVEDVLEDLSDADLAKYGLMRTRQVDTDRPVGATSLTPWHDVQLAMRQRDQRRLDDLLSELAWQQAGVILPSGSPIH